MIWFTAKNIAIFFALATTAFCVSTIVLAVEKADLEDELQDALDKLDTITSATTTTTTTTTVASPPSSEDPPSSVDPDPSTTTPFPWPTLTVPTGSSTGTTGSITGSTGSSSSSSITTPSGDPNVPTMPTLPPGLPDPEKVIYRLPNEIRPVKYKIRWNPDLTTGICDGFVSIQIEVDTVTNLIVMHAVDLDIDSISILNMMARMRIRVKKSYLAPEREMLFIELDELLQLATPYTVSISYKVKLNGLVGMYASTYLNEDGEER